jgi:hypothetical protein
MIYLNSIKFYLNIKFWTLEIFLCISSALLVKFLVVSLYFFLLFHFSSRLSFPHQPSAATIFPNAPAQSHHWLAPVFFR